MKNLQFSTALLATFRTLSMKEIIFLAHQSASEGFIPSRDLESHSGHSTTHLACFSTTCFGFGSIRKG